MNIAEIVMGCSNSIEEESEIRRENSRVLDHVRDIEYRIQRIQNGSIPNTELQPVELRLASHMGDIIQMLDTFHYRRQETRSRRSSLRVNLTELVRSCLPVEEDELPTEDERIRAARVQ